MGNAITWLFVGVLAVMFAPRLKDMWQTGQRIEAGTLVGALVVVPLLLALVA